MVRDAAAGLGALAAYVAALISAYWASPNLVPTDPWVEAVSAAHATVAPPDDDIPLVGIHGNADSFTGFWAIPARNPMSCRQASGGPAMFAQPFPSWRQGELDLADHRDQLALAMAQCANDAHANGADVLVTVNRLTEGGMSAQAQPLNAAARDADLLCCIKATQESLGLTMRPGEARRYRVQLGDEVKLEPDPFGA